MFQGSWDTALLGFSRTSGGALRTCADGPLHLLSRPLRVPWAAGTSTHWPCRAFIVPLPGQPPRLPPGCLPCFSPHTCVLAILQNQPRIHLGFKIFCDHQIWSVLKEAFLPYRIHNRILPSTFLISFFSISVSTP